MRSASSRKVTTIRKRPIAGRYLFRPRVSLDSYVMGIAALGQCMRCSAESERDSRLDGIRQSVQHVLNLARLHAQLVERTGVVPGVVAAPSIAEGTLVAEVVARCATYLRHGCV